MTARRLLPIFLFLAAGLAHEPVLAAFDVSAAPAAQAQSRIEVAGLPSFEFETQVGGEVFMKLGSNVFTPQQLLQFVAGVPEFIENAAALAVGQRLVLRQQGELGYVSLTAVREELGNRYTLTFQAEAPSDVASVASLRGLGMNLAEMVLTRE